MLQRNGCICWWGCLVAGSHPLVSKCNSFSAPCATGLTTVRFCMKQLHLPVVCCMIALHQLQHWDATCMACNMQVHLLLAFCARCCALTWLDFLQLWDYWNMTTNEYKANILITTKFWKTIGRRKLITNQAPKMGLFLHQLRVQGVVSPYPRPPVVCNCCVCFSKQCEDWPNH